MQQRQLRPGDVLDDYCPRERRVSNHVIVAMIGDEVRQTRCTTCDAEHEYKHARVPPPRAKTGNAPAALFAQVAAGAPKHVSHEVSDRGVEPPADLVGAAEAAEDPLAASMADAPSDEADAVPRDDEGEGPFHRRLIRAALPRLDGQPPAQRPIPEFTIRQPAGGRNRFRPRHGGGQQFFGQRGNGNGNGNGGNFSGNGRPQGGRRHGGQGSQGGHGNQGGHGRRRPK